MAYPKIKFRYGASDPGFWGKGLRLIEIQSSPRDVVFLLSNIYNKSISQNPWKRKASGCLSCSGFGEQALAGLFQAKAHFGNALSKKP
jgi:hypothetical protein